VTHEGVLTAEDLCATVRTKEGGSLKHWPAPASQQVINPAPPPPPICRQLGVELLWAQHTPLSVLVVHDTKEELGKDSGAVLHVRQYS
jgi:hypothetical protein